jgi:hypothetical protein
MHRINSVVDKRRMQQGPRFDVTRKGNRVPTSFSVSNTVHDNNDVRLQRYAPHKARCELSRRNDLFSEFVARNGRLEGSNYARRNQPHVCVRKDLSWTFSKKGCVVKEGQSILQNLPPPKAENKVPWIRLVAGFFPVLVHEPLGVE